MRKIVVSAFISLDGVMQAPGGREEDPSGGFEYGGWIVPLGDDRIGTVVLGRTVYERAGGVATGSFG